ncbi:MAG TPA: DUF2946 family protein [Comamonas sp.]|uniref:DUF2946 family protein n=1 Tax=Comamonas halotolerans TaxID=3041496 RepID=UPI0024E16D54|nr:DUF2946 family protein [Comamonas sp. NoAH]
MQLNASTSSLSRRAITGVLVLWLCVVAAGIWAPMARAHMQAQSMERLCSVHGVEQWVPSPVAEGSSDDGEGLHHLIDCPLCLPLLAPPPAEGSVAVQALPPQPPPAQVVLAQASHAQHWPPARGPPVTSHLF